MRRSSLSPPRRGWTHSRYSPLWTTTVSPGTARCAARLMVRSGRSSEPTASSDPVVATWNSDGIYLSTFSRSADAEEVFNSQTLDPGEAVALLPGGVEIVVFEGTAVIEQLLVGLPIVEGWLAQFADPACLERLLHFRIGTKRTCPVPQRQVKLHVGCRRLPHAVNVLGTQRLVIKVPGSVIGRSTTGRSILQKVNGGKGLQQIAVAEDQILIEAWPLLPVEVDVEQLPRPQRLRDPVGVVEARHLLMPSFGVDADHVGVLELVDERQRVADGRQEDVAPRLVRLGLDRKPHAIAAVDRVLRKGVHGFPIPIKGSSYILGEVDL